MALDSTENFSSLFVSSQVNAAFLAQVDPTTLDSLGRPRLVFGGASLETATAGHASDTEAAMTSGNFGDPDFLRAAMEALAGEVDPEYDPVAPPPEFRKHLTKALLYKVR